MTSQLINDLKKIWMDSLQCKTVQNESDFFECGGDSIAAIKLIARIYNKYGIELHLSDISDLESFENIVYLVESKMKNQNADLSKIYNLMEKKINKNILTKAQESLWEYQVNNPDSWLYSMPYVLKMEGSLDLEVFKISCQAVVYSNESLRTIFLKENKEIIQQTVDFNNLTDDYIDIKKIPISEVNYEIQLHEKTLFDLSRAPLIRFKLLCLGDQKYILMINTHHIIFDGWSYGILFKDLTYYYNNYLKDPLFCVPTKKYNMMNYVELEKDFLTSQDFKKKKLYWFKALKSISLKIIPYDYNDNTKIIDAGAYVPFELDRLQVQKLMLLKNEWKEGLFIPLLTIYQLLIHAATDSRDITIGITVSTRKYELLEDIIGFFINTIVMRIQIKDKFQFDELLRQNKKNFVKSYENCEVPLGMIIDEWKGDNKYGNPFFQTMFLFQNSPSFELNLNNLNIIKFKEGYDISRGDIVLELQQYQNRVYGGFYYNTTSYDRETILKLIRWYNKIFELCINQNTILLDQLRDWIQ